MSKEPIKVYHYRAWDLTRQLVEHLEALGRVYTIKKSRAKQVYYTSERNYYKVWWWPFGERYGYKRIRHTREVWEFTVEEWL